MQVTSNTSQYQALQAQQNPITLPVEPTEPKYSNKDIYEASNGNIVRGEDGGLVATPQGELNHSNAKTANEEQKTAEVQERKDSARSTATDFLAASSKKSQVEIYLAVATEGEIDSGNQTADIINSLRDVQKQNNAVQAYATYKEAQDSGSLLKSFGA